MQTNRSIRVVVAPRRRAIAARLPVASTRNRVAIVFLSPFGKAAATKDAAERARLVEHYDELLKLAKKDPAAAAKLLGKPKAEDSDIAETAAWTAFARTLLNLDEFVTRE